MQRRTFLTGTLLGAAFAAGLPAGASAGEARVTSLDGLQDAIDRAAPGDRIVLANGTYTVPAGGAISVFGKKGSTAQPITITAESRGGAVLQGERGFVFAESSDITVSGFSFRQRTTLEIPASCSRIRLTRNDFRFADISGLDWVVVRGDDAKIDRNHFHEKRTEGIFVVVDGPGSTAVAQRLHVFKNHFSDHRFAGANGGEPIRLGVSSRALSSAHAVVEYNLFERCDGDPETISVKSSDNTIRYNTIRDSLGGIVLRHGNRSTVDGNYLLGGTDGLRLYGNDHLVVNNYFGGLTGRALTIGSGTVRDHHAGETTEQRRGNDACDRAVIVHNTLVGNARTLSGETRDHEPRDVVVADNLLVGDAGSLVAMGKITGFTWQSNILWGAAPNGNLPAGGYVRTDPRLQQKSDGVFRLAAGSPAIGAATFTGASVAEDIDGHARGSARDIGADEYGTLAPVRRPLTAADVGPHAS
ncbi:polysaccharide lyase 6 family protein [Streptomyces chryseus]|uniref:polysaccharide lyase 6 family protein n=3 Tax=Streptomyces chryseus TaxID=68186 RepID=UPI00110FB8BC|nr:polysaccharide lyase 6 family protein [Streptomyces chryseus]